MGSGAADSRSGKWFDLEMRNYTPCRGGSERESGERERLRFSMGKARMTSAFLKKCVAEYPAEIEGAG